MVAHVILVSAQGPNPFFSYFGGTFIRLGGLFGQGLGLGPGLDNCDSFQIKYVLFALENRASKLAVRIFAA